MCGVNLTLCTCLVYKVQYNSLNNLSSLAGLVCINSYLYAVGGYDGRSQLCSVERYNIARNIWEPRASLQNCRSAHGVTVHQGRIFVLGQFHQECLKNLKSVIFSSDLCVSVVCLGGFNQNGFLGSVECYCPERNEWTCVTDMPVGRSGIAVAVTMEPCPGSLPEQEDEEEGVT